MAGPKQMVKESVSHKINPTHKTKQKTVIWYFPDLGQVWGEVWGYVAEQ